MNDSGLARLIALALLTAAPGAQAASDLTGHVSVGVAAVPEFEGAQEMRVLPYVGGELRLGYRYLALQGVTARANLVDSPTWELGPVASFAFGRDADVENDDVARLSPIEDAAEVGAFAAHRWSGVFDDADSLRVALEVARSDAPDGGGVLVTPTISYGISAGDRVYVRAEAYATHASADYLRTYYGVSSADAAASGLPTYRPDAGVRDVGVATTVSWSLTAEWSIDGHLALRRLVGDAADSPIVQREGRPTQMTIAIGIGRRF